MTIQERLIVMAPGYRPHAFVRDELAYRLRRALEELSSDIYVGSGSVLMTNNDMPQPDIVMTSEPRGEGAIPLGSVALLVEVSSTTLKQDMNRKAGLYASADVPNIGRPTSVHGWSTRCGPDRGRLESV